MIVFTVIAFLLKHRHLVLVDFFYNKLALAILYRGVGTSDDREHSFVGADKQQ